MSVRKYSLKFTLLSRYALYVVADNRSKPSKFVSSISDNMVKECITIMLIGEMDLFRMMVHA